ncbi:hypothetical protein M758_10G090900 [Ceratodon purpureus]|uniref:RWD domain-containing protein n=1 Tax=Ceratodon purpureus TaxID=3225 RepID=A0A8T0GJT9_CERPU|nr:hypothetical protein KC19_10G092500 [Ceratodon purpureus]KAG0603400.1 hypothetical protein M758_10G090900 [Ceratodon purpureus]
MEVEENRIAQAEELEVLRSIYGEEDCQISSTNQFCEVKVYPADGSSNGELSLRLGVHLPESYPSASCPVAELHASWLSENSRRQVVEMLTSLYEEAVGEVVVFRWVEWLKEQDWLWEEARRWILERAPPVQIIDEKVATTASLDSHLPEEVVLHTSLQSSERILDEKGLEELDRILGIVHGEPFTEKRSTFQAHLAPAKSADDVEAVMDALLRNRKIAAATHNIMAYRISMPIKNTVLQDNDDDGETAAGGRLLHLLQIVNALNVIVVVSRWYGGIQLGPDRFKHINNAARSLLGSCGYIAGVNSSATANQKTLPKSNLQKGKKR